MRRAVTLAEVLIATVVAGTVLTLVYQVFISGVRTFARGTETAGAMMNAMLALETLANDLAQLTIDEEHAAVPFRGLHAGAAPPKAPIVASVLTRPLSFAIALPGPVDVDRIETGEVTYTLVSTPVQGVYQIRRNERVIPAVYVRRMDYEFFPATLEESLRIEYLRTTVVATDPRGRESFTLVKLAALAVPTGIVARQAKRRLRKILEEKGPW